MHATTWWIAAATAAVVAAAGVGRAEPPAGDGPPAGLERLRKTDDKGKLPVGDEAPPQGDPAKPAGTRSLGHDGAGTPGYSPGTPGGERSSDPGSIGGGTRVGGSKSPLDDIH